nr:class I SAM-dependent methyltransferase [uncultured Peptostreptococcus sp.]
MKLSARLEKIIDLVDSTSVIADIGTDHGYIPIELLIREKINYAILADINRGPLENASREVESHGLIDKVDLRLGSGLEILKEGEVDQVIIAGMGGILISDLIEKKIDLCKKLDKLVLQPMQAQGELRKYLNTRGFSIVDEYLVKEDFRIYEIMVVEYSGLTKNIDEIYYEVPKKLIDKKDPLLNDFLDKKLGENRNILKKLEESIVSNGESMSVLERKKTIESKIEKLEKMYNIEC